MSSTVAFIDYTTKGVRWVSSNDPLPVTFTSGTGISANQVQGTAAHDAPVAGNPVLTGGYASATPQAAVTTGDAVRAWFGVNGQTVVGVGGSTGAAATLPGNIGLFSDPSGTVRPLYVASGVYDGTGVTVARGDTNATAMQPSLTALFWSYAAAAGGILNTTTAVTVKAAAGANVRNYAESIQLDWEALGAATEVVIRDGAGGTVLWRMKIGTGAAGSRTVKFGTALRGTANTLLEVVTLTASITGAVYVNLQGWTGA